MTEAHTMTVDSRLEEIPRLARWVNETLRDPAFQERLIFDIQVCLEEAIANIVLHAFKGEAGHPIQITMAVGTNDVRLDVQDSGPPFDPREVAELTPAASLAEMTIGGTGILLIRGLSQNIDYVRVDNVNRLSLTFTHGTGFTTDGSALSTGRQPDKQSLKRKEQRLALAVTGARLAIWEVDLTTGRHWWSPEFYQMLGYTEVQATAVEDDSLWERHLHPEDRDQLLAKLVTYLNAPTGPYDAVYRLVRVDGSVLWVEVKGHPTFDDTGCATHLNGVSFDVTARINAERELRQAQNELIQAEKMAALGSLVAGVAHEINTPIGNTLTAASHLNDRALALRKRLETEKIRKSDLDSFFDLFEVTTRLILRDTERAIELIQSFKQVAVDQTSGERRQFDLKGYIEEVFLSLRPRLRRTRLTAQIECPRDILMDSYPGALSQLLTNFVMNSLMHAFDAEDSGLLRVEVNQPRADQIELVYSDSGKGMSRDVLAHIFEPFFTTKRGAGGSGLGMHIVYNIVTATLRGTIRVESELGHGARFILRLPMHTPAQVSRSSADG